MRTAKLRNANDTKPLRAQNNRNRTTTEQQNNRNGTTGRFTHGW